MVRLGISKEGLGDFLTLSLNTASISKKVLAVTIDNLKKLIQGDQTLEQLWALSLIEKLMETVSLEEGKSFLLAEMPN